MPTFKRYINLFIKEKNRSILRALQYEFLKDIDFNGKVLDFGGGNKVDYFNIINARHYQSVNIDSAPDPSYLINVADKIPCQNSSFDMVLSLNTIEHIYDPIFVLKELNRVLKPGGKFECTLPFLYPIHAHPDDYFRPTASWWMVTLEKLGYEKIQIHPLLWGPFTCGLVSSGLPGPFKKLRLHAALLVDWLYTKIMIKFRGKYNENNANFALGYFIKASKIII